MSLGLQRGYREGRRCGSNRGGIIRGGSVGVGRRSEATLQSGVGVGLMTEAFAGAAPLRSLTSRIQDQVMALLPPRPLVTVTKD